MNRRLVDHVSPLIPVRLYGKPDVAIGHAVQLLPNVQAFFPTRLRVELCSLGPIIVGGGHAPLCGPEQTLRQSSSDPASDRN